MAFLRYARSSSIDVRVSVSPVLGADPSATFDKVDKTLAVVYARLCFRESSAYSRSTSSPHNVQPVSSVELSAWNHRDRAWQLSTWSRKHAAHCHMLPTELPLRVRIVGVIVIPVFLFHDHYGLLILSSSICLA